MKGIPKLNRLADRHLDRDAHRGAFGRASPQHQAVVASKAQLAKRRDQPRDSANMKSGIDAVAQRRAPQVARNPGEGFVGGVGDDDVVGILRPPIPIQNAHHRRHDRPRNAAPAPPALALLTRRSNNAIRPFRNLRLGKLARVRRPRKRTPRLGKSRGFSVRTGGCARSTTPSGGPPPKRWRRAGAANIARQSNRPPRPPLSAAAPAGHRPGIRYSRCARRGAHDGSGLATL